MNSTLKKIIAQFHLSSGRPLYYKSNRVDGVRTPGFYCSLMRKQGAMGTSTAGLGAGTLLCFGMGVGSTGLEEGAWEPDLLGSSSSSRREQELKGRLGASIPGCPVLGQSRVWWIE